MKKTILLFAFFIVAATSAFAQLSTSPTVQDAEGLPATPDIEAKFDVNNGTSAIETKWALEKGDDWPEQWLAWVCDLNLCYTPGIVEDPQFTSWASRESQGWSLHCNPVGIEGAGSLFLHITDRENGDTLTTVQVNYIVQTTDTDELVTEVSISLYPNPATDFFMIDNGQQVDRVQLFDLVGREIFSQTHATDDRYVVRDLRNGMYLVRLTDSDGEVLKSTRLSKR